MGEWYSFPINVVCAYLRSLTRCFTPLTGLFQSQIWFNCYPHIHMTITLRPMQEAEFPAYRDYFIVDYAEEIAVNFGHTLEKSRTRAVQELDDDLPQTVNTPDNFLLCLERYEQETIGYLWYKLLEQGAVAFILDFVVFAEYRGLGYGQASLLALQAELVKLGVEQIKLRVAFANQQALGLYKKMGFRVTGYNMMKMI